MAKNILKLQEMDLEEMLQAGGYDTCWSEAERLAFIGNVIKGLVEEVRDFLPRGRDSISSRAYSYWLPQLEMAIDGDHDWMGGCQITLADTVSEMDDGEELIETDEEEV